MLPTTLVQLATDQAIQNGLNTAVSWTVAHRNALEAWSVKEPSRITVPRGYALVRFRCGAVFQCNSVGMRQIWLKKNGEMATFIGYISHASSGSTGNSSWSVTSCSPWIDCTPGDFFELIAYQESGGVLSLRGVHSTWLEAEFYPAPAPENLSV